MASVLCGSAEAARQLREDTVRQVRSIVEAWKSLGADYSRYAPDIRDGSSDEMFGYQQTAAKLMESAMEDIARISQRLLAYELFVEKATKPYQGRAMPSERQTAQKWSSSGNSAITFDSPDALGKKLETAQKYGNCGLCAVQNIAYMGGIKTDQDTLLKIARENGWCDTGGGTTCSDRKAVLQELGIASFTAEPTMDTIVSAVMSGRGVIASVDAYVLYGIDTPEVGYHAVTVTSVTLDANGRATEVIVCDSNAAVRGESGAKRYSAEEFERALTGRPLNITDVIR